MNTQINSECEPIFQLLLLLVSFVGWFVCLETYATQLFCKPLLIRNLSLCTKLKCEKRAKNEKIKIYWSQSYRNSNQTTIDQIKFNLNEKRTEKIYKQNRLDQVNCCNRLWKLLRIFLFFKYFIKFSVCTQLHNFNSIFEKVLVLETKALKNILIWLIIKLISLFLNETSFCLFFKTKKSNFSIWSDCAVNRETRTDSNRTGIAFCIVS